LILKGFEEKWNMSFPFKEMAASLSPYPAAGVHPFASVILARPTAQRFLLRHESI
jgi:hypothetical protein